ncbi:MAG: cytochrome c oxidase subunit II [Candidatus Binatia bacterium]|nr:cytochrome c oxidase subunit II [Candidatus Binatia bacterium]
MRYNLPLFPPQASTIAPQVDALYYFLVAVSAFFIVLIFSLVIYFAIKYRWSAPRKGAAAPHDNPRLELLWTLVPLALAMVIFGWGAKLYFDLNRPPADALEIYVLGKQWMWILQHPQGKREINELHVPTGRPVKLTMTSEDVIHSFFIPAFRIKMDVLPGRYTTAWFEATQPGEYHLFCAEYCGTKHSLMIGKVVVMEPVQYQQWLDGGIPGATVASGPPEARGAALFEELRCATCHRETIPGVMLGPSLAGLFGKPVRLHSGESVIADEAYIRESILNPAAKLVAGYQPLMPTYQGQVSEEGVLQLIAYIRSLGEANEEGRR